MRLFNRTKRTVTGRPSHGAVVAGLSTFIADLMARDYQAIGIASGHIPMPATPVDWARYPKDPTRVERRNYFGGPSQEPLPQQRPGATA